MAVEIIQKKQDIGESITTQTLDVELVEKIDAFGSASAELKKALDALEPLTKLVSGLKKDLLAHADETYKTDESALLLGLEFDVKVGMKASAVQAIDKEELYKTLGEETFFELAVIGVGDIRKYCSPPQIEKILTEKRTGSRSVKIEKK